MESEKVQTGMKVCTVSELRKNTKALAVEENFLNSRTPNTKGTVGMYVAGHGGDVWWVYHEDGTVAPYVFDEINPVEE